MATLKIDSKVRVDVREIGAAAADEIKRAFTHANPNATEKVLDRLEETAKRQKGIARKRAWGMFFAAKKAPKSFETWVQVCHELAVPRGGIRRVYDVLDDAGISFEVVDERSDGDPSIGAPNYQHAVDLYDFQCGMVAAGLERQNGIWRSDTGSGKTTAALSFAIATAVPTIVSVWTGNLHDQWTERCVKELGIPRERVGTIRGIARRFRPITIAMQQTLYAMPADELDEILARFGTHICDELDRYGARTFSAVIERSPARYRLGVSADERRKDRCEFLIYDSFGSTMGPEIPRAELIERGVVVDVEVHAVPTEFAPAWYEDIQDDARSLAHDRLIDDMVVDVARCEQAVQLAAGEMMAGEQVILFTHRVQHARRLEADLRAAVTLPGHATGLLIGGSENVDEFRRVAAGLKDGSVRAAIGTYQAIAYGLDLPSVTRGICATPAHSNLKVLNQVRGRLCRAAVGKGSARLIYLWDRHVYGLAPIRQLRRISGKVLVQDGDRWVDAIEMTRRSK